jgi:type IV pilus assembly protein PilE
MFKKIKSKFRKLARDERGFTLTELMIVIVIIGILATWAIPKFLTATSKAKLSEYKLALEHVSSLEEVYYQEHDAYGATFTAINFDVPKSKYFEYSLEADSATFTIKATVSKSVKGPGGKDMKGLSVTLNKDGTNAGTTI